MHRRTVLASLPIVLSGCMGDRSTEDTPTDSPSRTRTETPTPTSTPAPEYSRIPPEPETIPTDEVRANLANRNCSALSDDPVVCPGEDARLSVSVSADVTSLPEVTVEITVRNDADEEFEYNDFAWRLYKYDGTAWRFLVPLVTQTPLTTLPTGETDSYRVITDLPADADPYMETRILDSKLGPIAVPGLGPGVYGFINDSGYVSEDDPLGFGATFGLSGEGPGIRPSDAVESFERDGGTLIVRGGVDENEPSGFEVSFTEEGTSVLLAEHVRFLDPLRNTLSFAATEAVDSIRYVTDGPDVDWALRYLDAVTPDGTSSYRFRDYRFEVEKPAP